MEKFITPPELRAIADACETLDPLWQLLTSGPQGGVEFDQGNEAPRIYCRAGNGDEIGYISWAEDGAALYLNVEE